MPTTMSADDLVRAVTDLEGQYRNGLVPAADVAVWCTKHGIDYGENDVPARRHFWNADHEEARGAHRLLKVKEKPERTSPNYFALRAGAPRAPAAASTHRARMEVSKRGWVECVWIPSARNGNGNWDWENAKTPPP